MQNNTVDGLNTQSLKCGVEDGSATVWLSVYEGSNSLPMESFNLNIWRGEPQQNKWWEMFADLIKRYADYFGGNEPFLGSLGATAWAGYTGANSLENRFAESLPTHFASKPYSKTISACTELFPPYFRIQTGFVPAYIPAIFKISHELEAPLAHWVTAIPHLINFLNLCNDLLSCSKEILAGESSNFVALTTQARRLRVVSQNFQ